MSSLSSQNTASARVLLICKVNSSNYDAYTNTHFSAEDLLHWAQTHRLCSVNNLIKNAVRMYITLQLGQRGKHNKKLRHLPQSSPADLFYYFFLIEFESEGCLNTLVLLKNAFRNSKFWRA